MPAHARCRHAATSPRRHPRRATAPSHLPTSNDAPTIDVAIKPPGDAKAPAPASPPSHQTAETRLHGCDSNDTITVQKASCARRQTCTRERCCSPRPAKPPSRASVLQTTAARTFNGTPIAASPLKAIRRELTYDISVSEREAAAVPAIACRPRRARCPATRSSRSAPIGTRTSRRCPCTADHSSSRRHLDHARRKWNGANLVSSPSSIPTTGAAPSKNPSTPERVRVAISPRVPARATPPRSKSLTTAARPSTAISSRTSPLKANPSEKSTTSASPTASLLPALLVTFGGVTQRHDFGDRSRRHRRSGNLVFTELDLQRHHHRRRRAVAKSAAQADGRPRSQLHRQGESVVLTTTVALPRRNSS